MTPVEALVLARREGVSVRVEEGRLVVEADSEPSTEVLAGLKQHRDRLVQMLAPATAPTPAAAVVCQRCGGPLKDTVEEAWRLDSLCRWAWQRGEA